MNWQFFLIPNRMTKFMTTGHNVLSSAWINYAGTLSTAIDLINTSRIISTSRDVG
jgi:hypothetical protein